jgi:hypothetical protein
MQPERWSPRSYLKKQDSRLRRYMINDALGYTLLSAFDLFRYPLSLPAQMRKRPLEKYGQRLGTHGPRAAPSPWEVLRSRPMRPPPSTIATSSRTRAGCRQTRRHGLVCLSLACFLDFTCVSVPIHSHPAVWALQPESYLLGAYSPFPIALFLHLYHSPTPNANVFQSELPARAAAPRHILIPQISPAATRVQHLRDHTSRRARSTSIPSTVGIAESNRRVDMASAGPPGRLAESRSHLVR